MSCCILRGWGGAAGTEVFPRFVFNFWANCWALRRIADGTCIGINGLALQALELEVFEVGLITLVKVSRGWFGGIHAGVSSRNIAKSPQHN